MHRNPFKSAQAILAAFAAAALVGACSQAGPPLVSGTPVPDASGALKVVNLDQGWDENTQLRFWFTTQGSQVLPYAWFLALERAASNELVRSDANLDRLGYLPARPGPGAWNPDGLPVGFAKTEDQAGTSWVGFTCAACHTGQVNVKGVGLRIDGAPAMADFNTFLAELVAALQATLADGGKFDRFASRVLGGGATAAQRDALRTALSTETAATAARLALNRPTHPAGPARVDAFGNILNQVLSTALREPGNAKPPDAPVSYPFLWDTPQHDKVQWNGSAPNGPFGIGELARNVGEVLGVFGGLAIGPCGKDECKYPNNVAVHQLGKLEGWLRSLWSPQWDPRWLGPIDSARAQRGKGLYAQQCQACHALIERADPRRKVTAVMRDVGTDPAMATAFATRSGRTGPLQGTLVFPTAQRYGATEGAGPLLGQAALGVMASGLEATLLALADQFDAQQALLDKSGAGAAAEPRPSVEQLRGLLSGAAPLPAAAASAPAAPAGKAVYKARPLNGIWATAPYLHNGSVPNLWQLLQAPGQRVQSFYVGSREFDTVDVGFATQSGPFRLDTSLPGNGNRGHAYGSSLADDAKRDLIEYLKTL